MKRSKLKEILEKRKPESRRYYRLYPCLYRDLALWEDFFTYSCRKPTQKIPCSQELCTV